MEIGEFKVGTKVFQVDQEALRMYLIVEGEVSITDRSGRLLASLLKGEFFGDEAVFNEKTRGYNAHCFTNVIVLSLSRSHLLAIISECPSVAISLLEAYSANIDFRKR